jgi:hypothetical protein
MLEQNGVARVGLDQGALAGEITNRQGAGDADEHPRHAPKAGDSLGRYGAAGYHRHMPHPLPYDAAHPMLDDPVVVWLRLDKVLRRIIGHRMKHGRSPETESRLRRGAGIGISRALALVPGDRSF